MPQIWTAIKSAEILQPRDCPVVGKKETKNVIFDNMSVYIENPKESTENWNGGILAPKWDTCVPQPLDSCPSSLTGPAS